VRLAAVADRIFHSASRQYGATLLDSSNVGAVVFSLAQIVRAYLRLHPAADKEISIAVSPERAPSQVKAADSAAAARQKRPATHGRRALA